MDTQTKVIKRSFSIDEFTERHPISRSQTYLEIKAGRLGARKVGTRTIITDEDEIAWLNSLPAMNSDAA